MKQNKYPRIAVDVSGGDHGAAAVVPGAIQAAKARPIALKLVGKEEEIKQELRKSKLENIDYEIIPANEVADMEDKPSHILRKKKHTSIQVACQLVKENFADGIVSAGNTGVTLACGIFNLGRIKGIERPGLASFLPRKKHPLILIDVGANVDSKPRQLVQFAVMAEVLAKDGLDIPEPKVGLLNVGEEQGKGNLQVNEAHPLLNRTSLNFVGNVEGRELFAENVDVAVCDGFVGNIVLKLSEGLGSAFSNMLKSELKKGFFSKLGTFLASSAFKRFGRTMDYQEHGGAPLLGVNGTVLVCHGSASSKAISKATSMTAKFIETEANEDIRHSLEANPEITRFQKLKKWFYPGSKEDNPEEESGDS